MNKAIVLAIGAAALTALVGTTGRAMSGQTPDDVAALSATVQRLTDLKDIQGIPSCYGYGHDLIFRHLGGDHSDAIEALRRCYADDIVTNVYLFDETQVNTQLHSIGELISFVETFAQQQGYSSARNVPGNVQVELTGPSTARVQSSTVAPHFLTAARPATDFVEARYVHNVARGADGVWRAAEFDLVVQQIWRGAGIYPFARP
jgi:hypothetical protein